MAIIDGTNGIGRAIDCKNIKEEKGMKELHGGKEKGSALDIGHLVMGRTGGRATHVTNAFIRQDSGFPLSRE